MRFAERILHALAGRHVRIHALSMSQVKGHGAARRVAFLELSYDAGKGHTTPHKV